MNISNAKTAVCASVGAIGGAAAKMLGGWSEDIATLVIFMAVDFAMGVILAGVFGRSSKSDSGSLESRAGWRGVCKKCVTLMCVLVANRLDVSLGTNYIRTTAVVAFIVNEAISIIENAGLMGIPIPQSLMSAIDILKGKSEEK